MLKTDMHSHLLPGIDDGSPDMEATLQMARKFVELGYQKVITTPHILWDFYKNTSEIISEKADLVRKALKENDIPLELEAAAEYFIDDHFIQLIAKNDLLTFGDNYILVEMGFMDASPLLKEALFELQSLGLKPILAHPERYGYWHKSVDQFETLVDRGVLLQVNTGSLTGGYGSDVKKMAELLIEKNMVSFIATDCHRMDHLQMLDFARRMPIFHGLAESGQLKNSSLL